MNHKGFVFFMALAVIASAAMATQRAGQRRLAFQQARRDRRAAKHGTQQQADEGLFHRQTPKPDMDVSLTSKTVPF